MSAYPTDKFGFPTSRGFRAWALAERRRGVVRWGPTLTTPPYISGYGALATFLRSGAGGRTFPHARVHLSVWSDGQRTHRLPRWVAQMRQAELLLLDLYGTTSRRKKKTLSEARRERGPPDV